MSEARRRKPCNRFGCKPTEDVCVQHDRPLECRHGCIEAKKHTCKDLAELPQEDYQNKVSRDYNPYDAGSTPWSRRKK